MRGRWLAGTLLLLSVGTTRLVAQGAAAQDAGPVITEASVGTAVADRQLQGAAESFPASVGTVFCYIKVEKTHAGATLDVVWSHSGVEVGRKTLNIGGSPWRTWSSKIVPADATGEWKVDITADGKVLKSIEFKVQ